MIDLPHEELLTGYLDDELTPSEREQVEELLRTSAEARQLLEELRAMRETLQALPRYTISAGQSGEAFAQRILQRAEREVLVQGTAAATGERPQTGKPSPPAIGPTASNTSENTIAPNTAPSGPGTFNGGSNWKKLLAAAAVLAASITLMVLGPAQRDQAPHSVALQSRQAPEANTAIASRDLATTNLAKPAPEAGSPGAAAFVPMAVPEMERTATPTIPAPMTAPAPGWPNHAGAAPPEGVFAPGSTAPHQAGTFHSRMVSPPAAEPAMGTFSAAAPHADVAAAPHLPVTNPAPMSKNSAAIRGMREVPHGRGVSPSLVVLVQLTEEAWQSGRFTELLGRRHIAWQFSTPAADELRARAERTESQPDRNQSTRVQQAGPDLQLVYAWAPADRMQELLSDLQSAAAEQKDVVALVFAAPDGPNDRAATLATGDVMHSFAEPFGHLPRSRETATDEIAPPFSPLDPPSIVAAKVQPPAHDDKAKGPFLPGSSETRDLQPDRAFIAEARGDDGPVERQRGRAIRLEAAGVETSPQQPGRQPAAATMAGSAAPPQMPQAQSVPAAAAESLSSLAPPDIAPVPPSPAASPTEPTTEALFVIQIVPSPGK